MPGPISDSYDPEWGSGTNRVRIQNELTAVYMRVSAVLLNNPPIYIGDLVTQELPEKISAELSEKEWRIIRFALERAGESL